jgi:DnaD/phage-associated family protein
MTTFDGFRPGRVRHVSLPVTFFSELLPLIDDLAELQVTLFCFYALHQKEGRYRYLRRRDFDAAPWLADALHAVCPGQDAAAALDTALAQAVTRGTLLCAPVELDSGGEVLYFLNTPTGRAAAAQVRAGRYRPDEALSPVEILPERPNIFALYEANIGALTPLITEQLKDAEAEYPAAWLEEALRLAVEHNKRSWRYIRAILERWLKEGKDGGLTGEHTQADGKKYISGEYAAFIRHRPDE